MDPTARQSIIDRINQATNVLVTVKNSPNVDQLAGCIGLTLFLNHMDKHGTAVFSGAVPSTIEFLKPEDTIEKTTDSLRDFIIALDKTKADKLRYKVENDVVKIFITPYRTSLSEKDFDFSQGDFNVDVVIALGVTVKEDLDESLVQHGRILHDATVISLNNGPGGNVGTLHLEDPNASSLCEMLLSLCEGLKPNSIDTQMATAFLTGIVAETERFSNPKTTPQAMSLAAKLMAAGANQQLIATQLQSGGGLANTDKKSSKKSKEDDAGTLTIEHEDEDQTEEAAIELPEIADTTPEASEEKPAEAEKTDADTDKTIDVAEAALEPAAEPTTPEPTSAIKNVRSLPESDGLNAAPTTPAAPTNSFPLDPPSRGGTLTANTQPQPLDPSTDPLSQPTTPSGTNFGQNDNLGTAPVIDNETISGIEQDVNSPHAQAPSPNESLDEARKAVEAAANAAPTPLETPQATGAQFLDPGVQDNTPMTASGAANPTEPASPPDLVPSAPLIQTPAPITDSSNPPLLDPNPTIKLPEDDAMPPPAAPAGAGPTPPPVPPPLPMTPPTPPSAQ